MGQCCGSRIFPGEEVVRSVVEDPGMKMKYFDYFKLLNTISDIRLEKNEIQKKYITEKLMPVLVDTSSSNVNKENHFIIIDELLKKIPEKVNLYQVIFLFYPFINHKTENPEYLYRIFKYMKGEDLTVKDVKESLFRYADLCTREITYIVWTFTKNEDIKASLDELNGEVYTEANIRKIVAKIMEKATISLKDTDILDESTFVKMIGQKRISFYADFRNMLLKEFTQQ